MFQKSRFGEMLIIETMDKGNTHSRERKIRDRERQKLKTSFKDRDSGI